MIFSNVRKGQSLVEAVFAIGILLVVLSAILGVTMANIGGSQESEFQIVANNLAREGIEVFRNTRDTNWLLGRTWDEGLKPTGVTNTAIAMFDHVNNRWTISFNYTSDALFISPDGLYSHSEIGNQPSIFSREITVERICLDADSGNERIAFPCAGGEQEIGMKISSRVSWTERGRTHDVTLEDLLYAWK